MQDYIWIKRVSKKGGRRISTLFYSGNHATSTQEKIFRAGQSPPPRIKTDQHSPMRGTAYQKTTRNRPEGGVGTNGRGTFQCLSFATVMSSHRTRHSLSPERGEEAFHESIVPVHCTPPEVIIFETLLLSPVLSWLQVITELRMIIVN